MEKIKKIARKGNYTTIKIIIALIIAFTLSTIYTVTRPTFIIDRIFLVGFILTFIELHFIIKLDKMYDFIYKYRYYISGITLILATVLGYSGSSIGVYNDVIQSESTGTYFTPVLGKYRSIRSDEWVVNTPIFVSQSIDKVNPFSYYNNNLRGTKTDMMSVVAPPVADILLVARPFNIGFILFGAARGLSIIWFGKWIAFALVSFEFFMLITKKKKLLSLCGAAMTIFSAAAQWWNMTDVIMWGLLALLLIDKYLKEPKTLNRILYALGIFVCGVSYVFVMYPAWQLPYLYIYIALLIYMCIANKNEYKLSKHDIPIIFCVIAAAGGIGLRYLKLSGSALQATMNTDYPGKRFEIGGNGLKVLFSYVYSYLFPYITLDNPCEYSGMLSFYPIPTVLAIIYLIRNKDRKKHLPYLLPLLILSIVFSIFSLFETNRIFAKCTLLYITTGSRLAVSLGFIQILILIYLLNIVDDKTKIVDKKWAKIISLILSVVFLSIAIKTGPANCFGSLKSYCIGLILLIFLYWLFTINDNENKKKLIYGLLAMSIITGITVNPIQKGISVLTDKPVAKEVQNIVQNDSSNNLWITDNTPFFMPNYLLSSGAKVLNSTNTYPNMDLYKTVLGEDEFNKEENRKIFNRYAHITMEITKNENKVQLLYEDSIKVYLTPEKIKELGIKYIVALRDISEFSNENVKFTQIYNEQGISIYQVN